MGNLRNLRAAPLTTSWAFAKRTTLCTACKLRVSNPRSMALVLRKEGNHTERQQELEAKLAALSFDEWLEKEVTEEQKKEIIPAMIYKLPSEAPKLVQMRQYFLKAVWPEKRKKS